MSTRFLGENEFFNMKYTKKINNVKIKTSKK